MPRGPDPRNRVVRALLARCSNECAFPRCTKPVVDDDEHFLGRICHIEAASPEGPRYNPESSDDERRGLENLMILCPNHHAKVDAKPDLFPVERLRSIKANHEARTTRTTTHYGVPQGTASFVGRQPDLEALMELLDSGSNIGVSASINGLAGIGKTELAIRLARILAAEGNFPGGIYWLDAEEPNLLGAWDAIGEKLGLPKGPERARLALRTVDGSGQRSLLILDNVTSWKAGQRPHPLPDGTDVQLLVTTRKDYLGTNFTHHAVQVLPAGAARELLVRRGVDPSADGFDGLLAYLDGHALALQLAGCYLRAYPDESPRGYLGCLRAGEDPGEKVLGDLNRYERTVQQVLQVLWDRLDAQTQFHWQVMAQMAQVPVSPRLMDACGVDSEARRALGEWSLVDEVGEGWKKMHRLVQTFHRSKDTIRAHESYIVGCSRAAAKLDSYGGSKAFLADSAHLMKAILDAENRAWVEPRRFLKLLAGTGMGLHWAGRYEESRTTTERALNLASELLGEAHPDAATLQTNLAHVCYDLGDIPMARVHLEAAIEKDMENLERHDPRLATRRASLAMVLRAQGDVSGAQALLSDAMRSMERHSATAPKRAASVITKTGLMLKDLGDLDGAQAMLELALARTQRRKQRLASLEGRNRPLRLGRRAPEKGTTGGRKGASARRVAF